MIPDRPLADAECGFTLVELMVVVTVIALAAGVAVLSMPDPRGRLRDEAARFAVRARAAHDAAMVEARPVSLWVAAGGYGFDARIAGAWVPIADRSLRVTNWQAGTRAVLAGQAIRQRVVFDETGLADRPLDVPLWRAGRTTHVRIAADGSVRIDA